ncbi:MAG: preprotein translocase subunit SecF [Dokdonia sp.]|jgi:preprotein translocase subunit SecF
MTKATLPLLILCLGVLLNVQAQETQNQDTSPKTVIDQYDQVISSSGNYKDGPKRYKVIDRTKLDRYRKQLSDSVTTLKTEITTLNKSIEDQTSEISSLNTNLTNTQKSLEDTNLEKDSMNFFGAQMSKGSYQMMMLSIIGVLFLGLLLFIFRFKSSNTLTFQAKRKLDELELDFDDYKRKALEKEQKLGRQLQDERNKLLKQSKG